MIDNLQIHVKNIHVRYEDGLSTPEHPLAAGFTLDEFRAVSTDSNWMEAFISSSLEGVHKVRSTLTGIPTADGCYPVGETARARGLL